ncbi:MAG: SCO family protein [Nitrospinae bacterium]|nr:SCO family protein [Nitrospinota bacterium]
MRFPLMALFGLVLTMAGPAQAQGHQHSHGPKVLSVSETGLQWIEKAESKIGVKLDPALTFINQDGKTVSFGSLFDKPLFVTFVFTDCPEVCPVINASLKAAVDAARKKHGAAFRALTISFDPKRDTPARMKEYGANFSGDFALWSFGTLAPDTVKAVTEAFGFSFEPDPREIWKHLALVSGVAKGGILMNQLYGMEVDRDKFTALAGALSK